MIHPSSGFVFMGVPVVNCQFCLDCVSSACGPFIGRGGLVHSIQKKFDFYKDSCPKEKCPCQMKLWMKHYGRLRTKNIAFVRNAFLYAPQKI